MRRDPGPRGEAGWLLRSLHPRGPVTLSVDRSPSAQWSRTREAPVWL